MHVIDRFTLRWLWLLALMFSFVEAYAAPLDLERSLSEEVQKFVQADATKPPLPCEIEFVGSSTIRIWGDALATDMAPMAVINRGFGGSQIEHVNRWFAEIVEPYHPSAIVFYEGDNDIDAGKSVEQVLADFNAFMALKTRSLGNTPVYFVSIKPSRLRANQISIQRRVNAAIRQRSSQRADLRYIDTAAPMLENGKPKDLFGPDGLHMTRAGYALWAQVIKRALEPHYESDLKQCQSVVEQSPHQPVAGDDRSREQPASEVDATGTVYIRSMTIPFSPLASEEAKASFIETAPALAAFSKSAHQEDVRELVKREQDDSASREAMQKWREKFGVSVTHEVLGGVEVDTLGPLAPIGSRNRKRVLISLHGGGFLFGAGHNGAILSGQAGATPIAGLGGIKVVTVDYRQGPYHRFPAASVDVASVYRELLKRRYPPRNIGIFGCSAGGMLTAQAVAWLQTHGLPKPGAIGIFGAGAMVPEVGDSHYVGEALMGMGTASVQRESELLVYFDTPDLRRYLSEPRINIKDPLVSPVYSQSLLSAFPPTLLISGTRDLGLSPAAYTHSQLVKNGVPAELHVWEGATHCAFETPADPIAPESREAWNVIVKFFDSHLGK